MVKLIEAAFLTEFDVDKGSTLRWAVPSPLSGYAANFFAEHQLPEGAHNREVEFTVFHLYPDVDASGSIFAGEWVTPVAPSDEKQPDPISRASADKTALRCINVARTRLTADRKRGAEVKALAFASYHPFIDQLRPMLTAALDVYFVNQSRETLQHIVDELNSISLDSMPVYDAVQRKLLRGIVPFFGKSASIVRIPAVQELTMPNTQVKDADAAASEPVAAEESLAPYLYWEHKASVNLWPTKSDSTSSTLSVGPTVMQFRVPLYTEPSTYQTAALSSLFKRYGEGVMLIYNAVLLEKRVLFLGHKDVAAGEVCNAVLACAHLICPPLGNIQHRLFPYATLHDLSFQKVKGYIAGVTNPIFEGKRGTWDLLCHVGPDDVEGKAINVSTAGGLTSSSAFTASTVAGSLVKLTLPDLPVSVQLILSPPPAATVDAKEKDVVEEKEKESSEKKTDAPAAPEATKPAASTSSSLKTAILGNRDAAAQAAAEALARMSRLVLSSPLLFTETSTPDIVPPGPPMTAAAMASAPTIPSVAVPWKEADHMFFLRARSGLKFGENWLRNAAETYTATVLQLTSLQERMEGIAASSDEAAAMAVSAAQLALVNAQTLRLKTLRATGTYQAFTRARSDIETSLTASTERRGVPAPEFGRIRMSLRLLRQTCLVSGRPSAHVSANLWDIISPASPAPVPVPVASVLHGLPLPPTFKSSLAAPLVSFLSSEETKQEPAATYTDVDTSSELLVSLDLHDRSVLASGDGSSGNPLGAKGADASVLFSDLSATLSTPEALLYFVAEHPSTSGGLHALAMGLLHSDAMVRSMAVTLISRIQSHPWPPVRAAAAHLNAAVHAAKARHENLPAALSALSSF